MRLHIFRPDYGEAGFTLRLSSIGGSVVEFLATESSGTLRCGPWGDVGFGLRAKEAFAECECGPQESLAPVFAGRCGFYPHRFAGHGRVEVRNSAGHVGLEEGCYAFLHETGHEIDWRGAVQVVFSFGTPYAGRLYFWR